MRLNVKLDFAIDEPGQGVPGTFDVADYLDIISNWLRIRGSTQNDYNMSGPLILNGIVIGNYDFNENDS